MKVLDTWWTHGADVPSVGQDGNPPALDEAQVAVGKFHLQGELGHPDGQFQRRAQVLVAEDDPGVHGTARLLPVHKHIVAVHGNLGEDRSETSQTIMDEVTFAVGRRSFWRKNTKKLAK